MRYLPMDQAIDRMVQDYDNQARRLISVTDWSARYPLMLEPVSALFCDEMAVTVSGYRDGNEPLDVEVVSDVYAHWTPHSLKVFDMLQAAGLNPLHYARTGAPFQVGIQNKKRKRAIKQRDQLTMTEAFYIYTTPYYDSQRLVDLLTAYKERALYNIDLLDSDPSLLLVGKPGSTGTGWRSPWNDRDRMTDHWRGLSPIMRRDIPTYYDQLIMAAARWPYTGAEIILPPDYRGIRMGARSDGDVEKMVNTSVHTVTGVDWTGADAEMQPSSVLGFQQLASKTRQVGNDPSSVLFGRGTTPASWTQDIWNTFSTEYHRMPFEPGRIEEFLMTPPATMETDDDAFVLLNADWGYQDHAPYMEHDRLVIPDPGRSLGADNMVLQGIQLITNYDYTIYMLESGQPFTMNQYLVTAGQIVGNVLRSLDVDPSDAQILQVGDDCNIRIRRSYVGPLLDILGKYLKLKGMRRDGEWCSQFILGHYAVWRSLDDVIVFVQPRAVKSVSSANMAGRELPEHVDVGVTYIIKPSDVALQAAKELADRLPSFLAYRGHPSEWLDAMQRDNQFFLGKAAMAADGYSDYLLDMFSPVIAPPPGEGISDDDILTHAEVDEEPQLVTEARTLDQGIESHNPTLIIVIEDAMMRQEVENLLQGAPHDGVQIVDALRDGAITVNELFEPNVVAEPTPLQIARAILEKLASVRTLVSVSDTTDIDIESDTTSEQD